MIWRILAVTVGFVVAALAGAVTLFLLGTHWAGREVATYAPPADEVERAFNEGLGAIAFAVTVMPVLSLVPAAAVVVIGEVARIRSLLYYIVAGGAAAAVMPLIAAHEQAANARYAAPYFSILATAGFAAGLVYWLIAGRRA